MGSSGQNVGVYLQLASMLLTLLIIPLIKYIWSSEFKRLRENDANNKKQIENLEINMNGKIEKIKEDINDMKNDMPFIYVTREDFIRSIDSVDRTVNTVSLKIDKVYEHLTRKGE